MYIFIYKYNYNRYKYIICIYMYVCILFVYILRTYKKVLWRLTISSSETGPMLRIKIFVFTIVGVPETVRITIEQSKIHESVKICFLPSFINLYVCILNKWALSR